MSECNASAPTQPPAPVQKERELEVARLKEERHQAQEMKRKEEYVKQCRLIIEERRLKVKGSLGFRV